MPEQERVQKMSDWPKVLDVVRLRFGVGQILQGAVGTVVERYGSDVIVEFSDGHGRTIALPTINVICVEPYEQARGGSVSENWTREDMVRMMGSEAGADMAFLASENGARAFGAALSEVLERCAAVHGGEVDHTCDICNPARFALEVDAEPSKVEARYLTPDA